MQNVKVKTGCQDKYSCSGPPSFVCNPDLSSEKTHAECESQCQDKYSCSGPPSFVCNPDLSSEKTHAECEKSCKKPGCPKVNNRCNKGVECNPFRTPLASCPNGATCINSPCRVNCSSGDICYDGSQCPSSGICKKDRVELPLSNCPSVSGNIDVQWKTCYASKAAMGYPGCHFKDRWGGNTCDPVTVDKLNCTYVSDDKNTNWNSGDGRHVNAETKREICENYGKVHSNYTEKFDKCVYKGDSGLCTNAFNS